MDVDGLKDGLYYPNVSGFDYYHNIIAKDREYGGTSYVYVDMLYPTELK